MQQEHSDSLPVLRAGVDNVFLALIPDEQSALQATSIRNGYLEALGQNPYVVPTGCLHVSLLDIATRKNLIRRSLSSTIENAVAALATLELTPFEVVFEQVLSFSAKSQKPFVLQMSQGKERLEELCKKLSRSLALASVHADDKASVPHMTLARAAVNVSLQTVEPVRWTVKKVVLVHSVVGQTRHIHLKSWPLG